MGFLIAVLVLFVVIAGGFSVAMRMDAQAATELAKKETTHRACRICGKWIPHGVPCDYDWSGQCYAGSYNIMQDPNWPPKSGRAR